MTTGLTSRRGMLAGAALAIGLGTTVMTGCASQSGGATAAAHGTATASACTAEAEKRYEAAETVNVTDLGTLPTVPVDASKAAGKRVAILVGSLASPPNKQDADQVQAALNLAKVQSTIFDTKDEVSLQEQLFNQVIGQRYDAIYIFGINVTDMTAPIKAAKAAGIPVIATSGYPNDPATYPPIADLYANVLNNDIGNSQLQADYALWKTNCTGPYALMTTDFGIFNVESKATADEVAKVCPSCQLKEYQINAVTNIVGNSRASALGALTAQPGLTAILSPDVFATYQIAAVHTAAGGKNVKFFTLEALPDVLPFVKTGQVTGDVQNYGDSAQCAWYVTDEILRALTGGNASDGVQVLPMAMVTQANLSQLPTFGAASAQLEVKYKKLWGLS